jgi:hypothetical protein
MTDDVHGWLIAICSNLPFGDGQSCENVDLLPFHFSGKERTRSPGDKKFW